MLVVLNSIINIICDIFD